MSAHLIIPDASLAYWLADLEASGRTFTAHLAKSNTTPGTATVLGDFTEADYTSYAAQTLGSWGSNSLDGTNHKETSAFPTINFPGNTGSSQNVYAVYITDDNGHLRAAWRIGGAPLALTNGGPGYSPTLTFEVLSEYTS